MKEIQDWNRKEIEKRANIISERFLRIWAIPEIEIDEELSNDVINIFDAEPPTNYRKLSYAIFFEEKIEVKDVTKLYVEVFKKLFDLESDSFFGTELESKIKLCQ